MNIKHLTYREIKEGLQDFSEEQLDMTATVYDVEKDEYFPITSAYFSHSDILDAEEKPHPVLEILGEVD